MGLPPLLGREATANGEEESFGNTDVKVGRARGLLLSKGNSYLHDARGGLRRYAHDAREGLRRYVHDARRPAQRD